MKFWAVLFAALASTFGFGDEIKVSELRKTFEADLPRYHERLKQAYELPAQEIALGIEIDQKQCESIKAKIEAQYKTNPFLFVFENGSGHFALCQDKKAHFSKFERTGLFGLKSAYLLQERVDFATQTLRHLFLDSDYRVVGLSHVSYSGRKLVSFTTEELDQDGNAFRHYQIREMSAPNEGIQGPADWISFVGADGKDAYVFEYRHTQNGNPARTVSHFIFNRADNPDWKEFSLPLTMAWAGGFYLYDSKWFHEPQTRSSLSLDYRDGKEACAYGSVRKNNGWSTAPKEGTGCR